MLSVGGLFSGIGGIELGLERAGMRVLWHCEADPYARAVLARHWPDVPCYEDVRELRGADVAPVDVLCGGFPCQDISVAGVGGGIDGARSGLWSEYARLVGELRPRYVVLENVAALLARGLERVLGDLAALGYDAEWDCIPAAAVGAPHLRDRLWLVAYPGGPRRRQDAGGAHGDEAAHEGRPAQHDHEPDGHGQGHRARPLADADGRIEPQEPQGDAGERRQRPPQRRREQLDPWPRAGCGNGSGAAPEGTGRPDADASRTSDARALADAEREGLQGRAGNGEPCARWAPGLSAGEREGLGGQWEPEPDVGRVAHGIPKRVDRLRCLGNAVVPQIPEWIGTRIIEWEGGLK